MAFGRKNDDGPAHGRFVVRDVLVQISGKSALQRELDEGDLKGWTLRQIVTAGKNDYLLVVWEKPTETID